MSLTASEKSESNPACSVVVCTRNRPEHLERCLSFIAKLDFPDFETVVVDNASDDDSSRRLAAPWGARYLEEKVVGLSRARNRGLEACRGDIIAYLDDDAVPESDWLTRLVEQFDTEGTMAATGRVCYPDDTHLRSDDPLRPRFNVAGSALSGIDRRTPNWFEAVNFGGVGIGANMAFRRKALEEINGFDIRLGRSAPLLGHEETYAFFSLVSRGYRVVYAPRAVVYHPCGAPPKELRARYLKDLYSSAAYASFLFFEEPDYRQATARCTLRGIRRNLKRMRGHGTGQPAFRFPRRQFLLAAVSGPFLYFRSRFANGS